MSKFNVTKERSAKTKNLAGGFAYKFDTKTELAHAVLTTFLEDKFYETGDERLERIKELVSKCDPLYVANLAAYARKENNLRSVTTVLLGELSKNHNGDSLVSEAISFCAQRPDDTTELVSYLEGKLPKQVKRGLRHAILKYDRYRLAKYKGESKEVSLIDVFNLVHPKVSLANKEQKKAWKDLMNGELASFDTWEVEMSKAKNDEERTKCLENLLLEEKMGYMAILRNLNNFVKYSIGKKAMAKVVELLTDPEEVKKSRQLPFRFSTAFKNVEGSRELTDAIVKAADISLGNMPVFKGKTLISVDSSGSMSSGPIEKAAIMAAALLKSNTNSDVILFDTKVQEVKIMSASPVLGIAQEIERAAHGGGTQTSLVFQYAVGKGYDRIIILSDNESWTEGYGGVQYVYTSLRESLGDPFVFAIDIAGYGTKDVKSEKVKHICGWNDSILRTIPLIEKGNSLVKTVENYDWRK